MKYYNGEAANLNSLLHNCLNSVEEVRKSSKEWSFLLLEGC